MAAETPLIQEYRQAVEKAWATLPLNEAEGSPTIPLTQVFVMLQAAYREPPRPLQEPPPDVLPTDERLEHIEESEPLELPTDVLPTEERIEHIEESKKEKPEEAPPPPPPPVPLGEALKQTDHLALLGEPGSGKSTTLQFIGLCFARTEERWPQEKLGLEESRVPILLNLPAVAEDLRGHKLLDVLAGEVEERLQLSTEQSHELVGQWRADPGLLVLLDGLDEVNESLRGAAREAIGAFARSPLGRQVRMVVASRPAGYAPLGEPFRDYMLKAFSGPQEAEGFLRNWLSVLRPEWDARARAKELFRALKSQPALRRLDNPLQLRLSAEVYAETGEVVHDRSELYRRYLEIIWERAEKRGAGRQEIKGRLKPAARLLAWHLHTGGESTFKALEQALLDHASRFSPPIADDDDARALLESLRRKSGLLVRLDGEHLAFFHQTLREYLVAERLKEAWKTDRRRAWRFLRPRLHLPEWREPLFLLASGMDDEEWNDFIQRVRHAHSQYERQLHRDRILTIFLAAERGEFSIPVDALGDKDADVRGVAAEALGNIGDPVVPALIHALADEDWDVRRKAAEALGNIGDPAVPALIQALADEDWGVRLWAAEALGNIGDPAVPALIRALKEDWHARRVAAEALGKIGDPRAVPALIQALKDGEKGVRQVAAEALGNIGDPRVVPALIHALADEDWGVCRKAAEALGNIGDPAVPALIQALADEDWHVRWGAAEALGNIGDPAVPALIHALADEDWGVRRKAAEALGKIRDPRAVPALIQALKDKDRDVRRGAAEALGKIGDPRAVPVLVQALREDWHVGWVAAEALGKIGDPRAVPALIQALKEGDGGVRRWAAEALGKIGDPHAVPALIQALKDEYWLVRREVTEALGKIGTPAVPALIQALKDEDWFVRWETAEALGKIGTPAVPALIQALGDESVDVRWWAAKALGRNIGDPRAVPALIQALKDEDWDVRRGVAEALAKIGDPRAVPVLIQALKEDWHVRWVAAEALGNISGPAVSALIQTLKDEYWRVYWVAAEPLGNIGDPDVSVLPRALKHEYRYVCWVAAKALGRNIGDPRAVPALIQALREDWHVRWVAAEALGKIGDPHAVPALIEALKDEDGGVRWGAAEALEKILSNSQTTVSLADLRGWVYLTSHVQNKESRRVLTDLVQRLERLGAEETAGLLDQPSAWQRWRPIVLGTSAAFLLGVAGLTAVLLSGASKQLEKALAPHVQGLPVLALVLMVFFLAMVGGVLGWLVEKLRGKGK